MNTFYDKIYSLAEPYWNTRQNDIHVPMAYDFARQLLTHYAEADEEVVLPAVLLHDVGWFRVPEERQKKAFGPNASDTDANRLHEIEGTKIASEVLTKVGYDDGKISEIIEIIDGHDSRPEAVSLNDKLVKDADKLWRFTTTGINIDHQRFGIERPEYLDWIDTRIEGWFFTREAKNIARQCLEEDRQDS